jgi:hypothetical protein
MLTLTGRTWYVATLVMALGANATEFLAKYHIRRCLKSIPRSAADPAERLRLQQVWSWHAHRSGLWDLVSLGLALLAIGFWLVSRSRREPGSLDVPIALLALYVSLFLCFI